MHVQAGQLVPAGSYIRLNPPDFQVLDHDGILSGTGKYRRLSPLTTIALAPLMGALFVMGFPVLVFVAVFHGIWNMTKESLFGWHRNLVAVEWAPGVSYLHPPGGGEDEESFADLEAEVREAREREAQSALETTLPSASKPTQR